MNHQDIADRLAALGREHGEAYQRERARIVKELESLRELCGGVGHIWGVPMVVLFGSARACVVCGQCETTPAAPEVVVSINRLPGGGLSVLLGGGGASDAA